MSAIFGIVRFDRNEVSSRDLERMSNTLAHRGPDGRKFTAKGAVGLGHCLLRVNTEDRFEAQPLYDRDADVTLVADCRIDNRDELAEIFGLSAADIREMPDSAFILHAYKKWGEDAASHLLGDFVFAIWDARTKKLVLGRDHMGQRNVFYHKAEQFIAFSSEVKALWALADVPRQLTDHMVRESFQRFSGNLPDGWTMFEQISSVNGGSVVAIGPSGVLTTQVYWEPHADPVHENRDEDYYVERYRSILSEAVDCRLRRLNAPAALMMSAGFDTAAIAGLAGPSVTAQGRKLISLSWISSPGLLKTRGDLRPWLEACQRVMPHLDVRQLSKPAENPLTGIEKRFMINDGPSWSHHQLNLDIFAAASATGARLIMDGFGGDYTLNPRGQAALAYFLRRGQWRRFAAELRAHVRVTGQPLWLTIKNNVVLPLLPDKAVRWITWLRHGYRSNWTAPWVMRDILQAQPDRKIPVRERAAHAIPVTAMRNRNAHVARRLTRGFAAGSYIPAGAFGLSLTRPFHDKRVVELGLAIPEDLYVKDGLNRPIARRALADIYPPEFQTRDSMNLGMVSDDPAVLDCFTPELLAEADRFAKQSRLSAIFNFDTIRGLLSLPGPNESRWIVWRKNVAMKAVLLSRYVEWFNADNRP